MRVARAMPILYVFCAIMFGGMFTMLISSSIAKQWLTANTGYRANTAAVVFLGPILTAFGPMKTYAEVRRTRNLSTSTATVFWIGTACWGGGLVGFLATLFATVH